MELREINRNRLLRDNHYRRRDDDDDDDDDYLRDRDHEDRETAELLPPQPPPLPSTFLRSYYLDYAASPFPTENPVTAAATASTAVDQCFAAAAAGRRFLARSTTAMRSATDFDPILFDAAAAAAAASADRRKDSPCIAVAMIHPSNANWPPSRKREEARALENLRKRVERSQLRKTDRPPPPTPTSSQDVLPSDLRDDSTADRDFDDNHRHRQSFLLDNRPQLLRKILGNKPMTVARDGDDLETDWRDSEFITECLCWHNVYRQRHNAPPLTMSPQLCEYAQTWANRLAHTNAFYYRNDRNVGQNLYCRPGGADVLADVTGQDVAFYWYSAVKQYDFLKEPDVLHANVNAGHFTQLVWASSRYFGVGKARSRSGKIIVVANYRPVGNVSGHFQNNVLPPLPENFNAIVSSPPPLPPLRRRSSSSNVFHDRCVAASDSSPPPPSANAAAAAAASSSSVALPYSDVASTDSDDDDDVDDDDDDDPSSDGSVR